jgi:acetyltransferase-like isoleucine patch superfamily enzyme
MIRRQPPVARLVQDLLGVVFLAIILFFDVGVAVKMPRVHPVWIDVARRIMMALAVHIVVLSALRIIVPKPTPGSHLVRLRGPYLRWLISSSFARVAMNPIFRAPYWFLNVTRFLYLRALGARVGWGAAFPSSALVRDPSLMEVGAGAQIEPGVVFESAVHSAGRVHVESVSVGGGTLIGAHVILMPGAAVGHDARVGAGAFLGTHVRVGVSSSIGPRAVLSENVDVGSHAVIGAGAVLSDGVVAGDRARVLPGAVVSSDAQIGDREVWGGSPARLSQEPPGFSAARAAAEVAEEPAPDSSRDPS